MESEYLEKLFAAQLKPIENAILEMKNKLNSFPIENIDLRIKTLEENKKLYKVEFINTVERVSQIENRLNNLHGDSTKCKDNCTKQIDSIKTELTQLKNDLSLSLIAMKNPKYTIMILIGLYLFAISEYLPKFLKSIF